MSDADDQVERVLEEIGKEVDSPAEVDPHEDRTHEFRRVGFARMRTDWEGPDGLVVQSVIGVVENRIITNFADAWQLMNELYDIVRTPRCDPLTGEILRDSHGWPIWDRTPYGAPLEDWTLLTSRQKEDLLFRITSRLFEWEQLAADAWTEAMLAKAKWEESFAASFTAPQGRHTVDDRTQQGRLGSRDDRYFAVFLSAYSRKADALVRSMERLGQRLKDTLPAR